MPSRNVVLVCVVMLLVAAVSLGCALTDAGSPFGVSQRQPQSTLTATPTRTRIARESIDFGATALAATIQAAGGYLMTSTPLPVWPTLTSTPFDQVSFLATINAQFAHATETAIALATPTFTPSPTLPATATPTRTLYTTPPPILLPPAGGVRGVP